MKKVLLISGTGNDNFGDEAMFKEIYKQLSSEGYDITVAYFNFDLVKTKRRYPDVNFIKLPKLPTKLGILNRAFISFMYKKYANLYDALYITGSGNYTSIYSAHIERSYFLVNEFKRKGKYVEFRPQSVGPFHGNRKAKDEYYVRRIIELSDKFFVRDYVSYEYARKISENVKLTNDEAWNLEIIKPKGFDDSLLKNEKLIGLSIRPFRAESDHLVQWFNTLVDSLLKEGYKPFFIPISYNEMRPEYQDNHFLKSTIKDKGIFLEDIIDVKTLHPENIKYFISLCEKCVGLSYHFNVFSLSQDKRIISLYYEDYYKVKNLGLQKAFGDIKNVVNPINTEVNEM